MVDVAQLVRVSVCETEGCGFKTRRPPQMTGEMHLLGISPVLFYMFPYTKEV